MKTTSKILSILLVLAMVLSIAPFAFAAEADATLSFATTDNRVEYSTEKQVWKQNGITVTNEKAQSRNDVGDYKNPARFYAGSTLNIAYTGMRMIVLTGCEKDMGAFVDAVNDIEGAKAVKNDTTIEITFAAATDSLTVNLTAQIRIGAIQVYKNAINNEGEQGGTETAPELKDISVALAGANDASFKVKGVVTCIDDKNIYLQDATGAICARVSEKPTDIKLGDTIIAVGKKSVFNGLPQLGNATYEKSTGLTLTAKETTIGALTNADICGYVSLKDLEVTEVYDNNGQFSSPNITVKDAEGKTIQLYKAVIEKKDGAWTVKVGDVIDVKAAVSIYNKLQLRNTSADEIVVQVKDTTPTPDPNPTPEHEHKLTKVEKVDATTEKEGCKEHYKCECGKLFTDAEGKNETTADELAIAKLTNTETDKKDDTSDKKDETTGSGYTKVTDGKLVSGTYVLVTSNGYAPTVLEKNWLLSAQPTVSGNKVTDAKNAVLVLTVDGNKVKITDANGNTVINQAKNNKLDNLDGMWNWKYDSATGTFTFDDGVTEEGQTRYLAAAGKNDNKFRAYRNPSSEPDSYGNTYYHQFTLYKLTDGSNVSTGDNTNVVAIVAIMIVAMAGMAVIVTNRKNWNV